MIIAETKLNVADNSGAKSPVPIRGYADEIIENALYRRA